MKDAVKVTRETGKEIYTIFPPQAVPDRTEGYMAKRNTAENLVTGLLVFDTLEEAALAYTREKEVARITDLSPEERAVAIEDSLAKLHGEFGIPQALVSRLTGVSKDSLIQITHARARRTGIRAVQTGAGRACRGVGE